MTDNDTLRIAAGLPGKPTLKRKANSTDVLKLAIGRPPDGDVDESSLDDWGGDAA